MKKSRYIEQWKWILISALCLVLAGCGSLFPFASTSPLTSTSQVIHYGTGASFDCGEEIISIASSGYGYYMFIDMFGKIRSETTSGLWIRMDNHPEKSRDYRAYTGLVIYYYDYKIEVLRLGRDLQNQFTEVSVGYMRQREIDPIYFSC